MKEDSNTDAGSHHAPTVGTRTVRHREAKAESKVGSYASTHTGEQMFHRAAAEEPSPFWEVRPEKRRRSEGWPSPDAKPIGGPDTAVDPEVEAVEGLQALDPSRSEPKPESKPLPPPLPPQQPPSIPRDTVAEQGWSMFWAGKRIHAATAKDAHTALRTVPHGQLSGRLSVLDAPAQFAQPAMVGVRYHPPFRLRFDVDSPVAFAADVAIRAFSLDEEGVQQFRRKGWKPPKRLCAELNGNVVYRPLDCTRASATDILGNAAYGPKFLGHVEATFESLSFNRASKMMPVWLVFIATVPTMFDSSLLHHEKTIIMSNRSKQYPRALEILKLDRAAAAAAGQAAAPPPAARNELHSSAVVQWGAVEGQALGRGTDLRTLGVSTEAASAQPALLPPGCSMFGLFDGHQGAGAAELAKEGLARLVAHNLLRVRLPSDPLRSPQEALAAAFEQLQFVAAENESLAGSGASLLVALFLGRELLVASAGTSSAVLCRGGRAQELAATWWDCHRDTDLRRAAATAAGDRLLLHRLSKLNGTTMGIGPGLAAAPKVAAVKLAPEDGFLLLADQSLWNVLDAQAAVQLAATFLEQNNNDPHICAQLLAHAAQEAGAREDMAVMVVCLRGSQAGGA